MLSPPSFTISLPCAPLRSQFSENPTAAALGHQLQPSPYLDVLTWEMSTRESDGPGGESWGPEGVVQDRAGEWQPEEKLSCSWHSPGNWVSCPKRQSTSLCSTQEMRVELRLWPPHLYPTAPWNRPHTLVGLPVALAQLRKSALGLGGDGAHW